MNFLNFSIDFGFNYMDRKSNTDNVRNTNRVSLTEVLIISKYSSKN